MVKITKAEQIAQFCAQRRAELGIETTKIEYDAWRTVYISDDGLFRFNDEQTVIALHNFSDTVSAESARKIGGRQYKKSMNDYLVGVDFNPSAMSDAAVWNYMNGKNVKIPRVYTLCHKLIPIEKNEYFRDYDITDDGLIEAEFSGKSASLFFAFEDIPKNGCVNVPVRLRLQEGVQFNNDVKGKCFSEGVLQLTDNMDELWVNVSTANEYRPSGDVLDSRTGSDADGNYLDIRISIDVGRF